MRLATLLQPLTDGADPHAIADFARAAEGEGYAGLWMPQAIGRGFMFPDPWVALAVAATATRTLELGTAVVQVPLYAPLDLAHRVFSLQQVAGRRLSLGVGAGSTAADFGVFGRDHGARFAAFRAAMAVLREAFATGGAGGHALSPWPAVRGGPPLLLGSWGNGVATAARDYAGWIASANYRTVDEVVAAHTRYRAAGGARAIVSTIQVPADADLGALRDKLARFAAAGFDDAVVMPLPGASLAAIRRLVD